MSRRLRRQMCRLGDFSCSLAGNRVFAYKMTSNGDKTDNKWVFVVPNCVQNAETKIVSLPHPKTGKHTKFMVAKSDSEAQLFEIRKHDEKPSSWFVGDTVLKDGSMFVTTPFDPLFLLLPFLKTANPGKFVLLNQLLTNVDPILESCLNEKQLEQIADTAGSNDMKAYRYNEEKVLVWLERKVKRLNTAIKDAGIFVWEKTDNEISDGNEHLRYSCGMLCDYIDANLAKKLLEHLKLPEKTEKRKSCGPNSSAKKIKTEASEDYSQIEVKNISDTKPKLSRSQKILSKVDKKGMKSMDAFFKPKVKKA